MKFFYFTLLSFVVFASAPGQAAVDDRLRQIEQQLNQKKQQQEQLDKAAQETSQNLQDLRTRLIAATQSLQDKQNEEETLEDRLDDLAHDIDVKSKKAAQERAELAQIISALVEIASRPPETLFLQNGVTVDHVHRSLLLRAILPRIKEEAESTARDLVLLYDLQEQMAAQKRLVAAAQENLQKQRQGLDQLIGARQGFLQRTEAQKADIASHLAALSDQAKDLRQLMQKVTPAAKPSAKTLPKIPATSDMALKWPVAGSLRRHFGDKDNDGVTSEGLTLAGPSGAPIVAPVSGKVVFTGPFRGYGQIMILQHAGGYHSFLAGFGRIDAEMGQDVDAGEPLGVLPVKPGSKPELYFEWRRGDEPIDPTGGLLARKS